MTQNTPLYHTIHVVICGTLGIQLFYNDSKMDINKFLI